MVDKTAEQLEKLGVEVEHVTPLTRSLGDVVHFFGCFEAHWAIAEFAIQKGVPIVWNPIYSTHRTAAAERSRAVRKRITHTFPRLIRKIEKHSKAIITLTEKEEDLIAAFFRSDRSKFHRIPHGVEERFAAGDRTVFRNRFGIDEPFVLHCGMFTKGKNQLTLIRALEGTGIALVCLGAPFDHAYYAECKRHGSKQIRILDPLDHDDPALPGAYAAATTFALPSHNEVFPLTALEAAVAGCSLVFGSTWGAQGIYGDDAAYAHPASVEDVREHVVAAFKGGRQKPGVPESYVATYSWPAVIGRLKSVYEDVISSRRGR